MLKETLGYYSGRLSGRLQDGKIMSNVMIVRHGQANSQARDEASYDQLSATGHQQAKWLGEYFGQIKPKFEKIYSGTLTRQIETAQGINQFGLPHAQDARLNEMDYFGLAADLERRHNVAYPTTQAEFAEQIKTILRYWKEEKISSPIETYESFQNRILSVVHDNLATDENVLLVSSSGVIASVAAEVLNVEAEHRARLFLGVPHTSLNSFDMIQDAPLLTQFCATPHLDLPKRVHAKTYI